MQLLELRSARVVQFLGRLVGGGLLAHQRGVHRVSTGVAQQPTGIRRAGHQLPGHRVAQLLQGRDHITPHRRFAALLPARGFGFGHALGQAPPGVHEGAAHHIGADLPVQLSQHAFEHRARRHPTQLLRLQQLGDFLVDAARVLGQARQHLFPLFGRVHRLLLQQA